MSSSPWRITNYHLFKHGCCTKKKSQQADPVLDFAPIDDTDSPNVSKITSNSPNVSTILRPWRLTKCILLHTNYIHINLKRSLNLIQITLGWRRVGMGGNLGFCQCLSLLKTISP
ncbi:hypothetical protein POM88_011558 [Heracleum sosnowskyi]|uniref:Uncharacterized protein n=1 Tax=Heracleum sosnowskyi TaxID=360622 RepID=A0AAD8IY59_9APIA|nr:hypothetical protein POM88_011558 [Heracleum sosnowskyi]